MKEEELVAAREAETKRAAIEDGLLDTALHKSAKGSAREVSWKEAHSEIGWDLYDWSIDVLLDWLAGADGQKFLEEVEAITKRASNAGKQRALLNVRWIYEDGWLLRTKKDGWLLPATSGCPPAEWIPRILRQLGYKAKGRMTHERYEDPSDDVPSEGDWKITIAW